jgi:hypothetical protein
MQLNGMKTHKARRIMSLWSVLLAGVLLAGALAFLPATAQAATVPVGAATWWPHFFGSGSVLPGFSVTGEVTKVETDTVTLELPNHHASHHSDGMMRFISLQVKLAVNSDSVLLDGDLGPLTLSSLKEGDEVVVMPRLVWGNLVAQLLYAGDPEELADASYRGRLVSEEGNTLTLENGRDGEFVVQVDDATVWYDNGRMDRPAALSEGMTLRVLGTTEKNDAGDKVIHAVFIRPD